MVDQKIIGTTKKTVKTYLLLLESWAGIDDVTLAILWLLLDFDHM